MYIYICMYVCMYVYIYIYIYIYNKLRPDTPIQVGNRPTRVPVSGDRPGAGRVRRLSVP